MDMQRKNQSFSWLQPIAWLYEGAVRFRNQLFDWGVLKEHSFPLPVICIGNLTVGGTGKTPHTEYIIHLLKDEYHIAVLSRGYKRKSKGFVLATPHTPMPQIGDEPFQMKHKYPQIEMAVDADRCHGIKQLMQIAPPVDIILLDDAFQHRYVKAGLSILLVDYNRPITTDRMLPAGRLREPLAGKARAQLVVVTKCPPNLTDTEFQAMRRKLCLRPDQQLCFSTLHYGTPYPVFDKKQPAFELKALTAEDTVLLLTGIANPKQMEKEVGKHAPICTTLHFPDHHHFSAKDAETINQTFAKAPRQKGRKLLLTTEKDATRLQTLTTLSNEVKQALFALPIQVRFINDRNNTFNEIIEDYVSKNSRNSSLSEG